MLVRSPESEFQKMVSDSVYWCRIINAFKHYVVLYCTILLEYKYLPLPLACKTVGGENCVFPFTYDGRTYSGCTLDGGESKLWCATGVDNSGNYVGKYDWGTESCPQGSRNTRFKVVLNMQGS